MTHRARLTVLAAAGYVAAIAAYGWQELELRHLPDFELYTQGGLGLFPSPLGRALGALGPDTFAAFSIIAAALVVVAAALPSSRPGLAAWLLALSPLSLYLCYAGIDSIGLALLLVGLAASSSSAIAAAALAHMSLAPFVLLELRWRSWQAAVTLTLVGLAALLALALTPYGGLLVMSSGVLELDAWREAAKGAAVGLLLSFPAIAVTRPGRLWLFAYVVGVAECLVQSHLQARYMMPAAALAVSGPVRPWFAACELLVRSAVETRRMPGNAREALSTPPSVLHTDAIGPRRAPRT